MALLTCPDCGGKVSSLASACPHCGRPIQYIENTAAESPLAKLEGAAITYSSLGAGVLARVTEDRIIIQCCGKQYQIRPTDFLRFGKFEKDEYLTLFRKLFFKESPDASSKNSPISKTYSSRHSRRNFMTTGEDMEDFFYEQRIERELYRERFYDCGPDEESYGYYHGDDE